MALIFESLNFTVEAPDKPHVTRLDGGHIVIRPKVPLLDRTQLSPPLAKELMMLTMIAGEAMMIGMNRCGIDVARLNYQDNGNWHPDLHIHLYGRAKSALHQKYGESLRFPKPPKGYYEGLEPLTEEDIAVVAQEIARLLITEKYRNF